MILQEKNVKRAAIYLFTAEDGIADGYVFRMLEEMKTVCSRILLVHSSPLSDESREKFGKYVSEFAGIQKEKTVVGECCRILTDIVPGLLGEYDEAVILNDSLMGPVYPFAEMFRKMEEADADLWSITKRDGFLSSDFFVLRKNPAEALKDEKNLTEKKLTKILAAAGMKCAAYIDPPEYAYFSPDDLFFAPAEFLKAYGCPVFEVRSFLTDYYDLTDYATGDQGRKLYEYLKQETEFDTDLIWEHILRCGNMADIRSCLNLCYILPKNRYSVPEMNSSLKNGKTRIALVMHEHYADLIEYCFRYASYFPVNTDVIITAGSEETKSLIEKQYEGRENVRVIFGKNRGRDIRSLLIEANPFLRNYDLVCYVHDKKSSQQEYGITGFSYMDRCFENLIGSRELTENIVSLFRTEPRLGVLCVPTPNHSRYYDSLGDEWGPNYDNIRELAGKLELHVPMCKEKEPVSPFGTMFWFRPEAVKKILDYGWKYEDFPEEPVDVDGTILHAIERIYTFVAQDAGYYTANVLNDEFARTETVGLEFMLRNLNAGLLKKYGRATNRKMAGYIRFPGLRRLYPPAKKLMPADMRKNIKNKYMQFKREKRAEERKY